jgi:pimeloyl-ACP methyl ester carboxylesterase
MALEVTELGSGDTLVAFVHGVLGSGRSFDRVADLLGVLDGRRAAVVGHSFGGVTALGAAARAPELVAALVLCETGAAWVPAWDDGVMRDVLGDEDPEGAGLRVMLGDRYDTMSDDERVRRRVDASAFIAEETSVRTGTPPFAVADIQAPLVYAKE